MSQHPQDPIKLKKNYDFLQTNVHIALIAIANLVSTVNGVATSHGKYDDENTQDALCADVESMPSKCERHRPRRQHQHYSMPITWSSNACLFLPAETTALVVVDVQNEYWSDCPSVRTEFPDFPQNLARTIGLCRERRVKIIWIRADYRYSCSPWLPNFERMRGDRNLGEIPCNLNSPELEWEDFARPIGGEIIVPKHNFSSTSGTPLVDILRASCVDTVLVCGLITSVCVHHSAYGMFEAGFRTILVQDACADRGIQRHQAIIELYGDYIYDVINTNDLESKDTGLIPAEPLWIVTQVPQPDMPEVTETPTVYDTWYDPHCKQDDESICSSLTLPTYDVDGDEEENQA